MDDYHLMGKSNYDEKKKMKKMGQNITSRGLGDFIDSDSLFLKEKPINLIDLKKKCKKLRLFNPQLIRYVTLGFVQCPLTNCHHFGSHFPPEQRQWVHCELWKINAFTLVNPNSDKL